MGSTIIFFAAIGVIAFLMWIGALMEVIRHDFKEPHFEIMWFLIIFILPIIGPLAFLVGKKQANHNHVNNNRLA